MEFIPRYADVIPVDELIELVTSLSFVDYDGFGYWITDIESRLMDTTERVYPSEVEAGRINPQATHVAWFNR